MTPMSSIVFGAVSGILTYGLISLAVLVFERVVIPWYQDLVYRGVRLDGTWEEKLTHPGNLVDISRIQLYQHAQQIKGDVTSTKLMEKEIIDSSTFTLEGVISDRFLIATFKHKSRKRLGSIAIHLEIVGNGRRMIGYTSWYDATAAYITSQPTTWTRVGHES